MIVSVVVRMSVEVLYRPIDIDVGMIYFILLTIYICTKKIIYIISQHQKI